MHLWRLLVNLCTMIAALWNKFSIFTRFLSHGNIRILAADQEYGQCTASSLCRTQEFGYATDYSAYSSHDFRVSVGWGFFQEHGLCECWCIWASRHEEESDVCLPRGIGQLLVLASGLLVTALAAAYVTQLAKDAVKDID